MEANLPKNDATLIDKAFQLAYKGAYQLMRAKWHLLRPTTHGALVAVWCDGEILLVKNSYVSYYSLPGGYVRPGERAIDSACRELKEEVRMDVESSGLELALEVTHAWQGKQDHVCIFRYETEQRPTVAIDHREVVHSAFYSPAAALELELFPPLRRHIEDRQAAAVTG